MIRIKKPYDCLYVANIDSVIDGLLLILQRNHLMMLQCRQLL